MIGHRFRSKTTKANAQLILVSLALLALLAYIIIMANDQTKVSAPRSSFPHPDLHAVTKHRHPLVCWTSSLPLLTILELVLKFKGTFFMASWLFCRQLICPVSFACVEAVVHRGPSSFWHAQKALKCVWPSIREIGCSSFKHYHPEHASHMKWHQWNCAHINK